MAASTASTPTTTRAARRQKPRPMNDLHCHLLPGIDDGPDTMEDALLLCRIAVADGIMIARGDLGAELPYEEVPLLQDEIIRKCRKAGKPVVVATHMLESMIVNPTPTRAEVTDISHAVLQGTDAIMLSGETATGKHPFRALETMDTVARRIEKSMKSETKVRVAVSENSKEEIARSAAILNNNLFF